MTLDDQGNPNTDWIFQAASTLITASNSSIVLVLVDGARACNVFWQVGRSTTLGTNADFVGTIMAQVSISVNTGAEFQGRALVRTGSVTVDARANVGRDHHHLGGRRWGFQFDLQNRRPEPLEHVPPHPTGLAATGSTSPVGLLICPGALFVALGGARRPEDRVPPNRPRPHPLGTTCAPRCPRVLRLLAGLFLVVAIVNAVVATCDHVVWPLAVTSLSLVAALVPERHTTTLVGVASSR